VLIEYDLSGARDKIQIDVGFGNAVTPKPETVALPSMLDLPTPTMRANPMEVVVAEKYEAMVALGLVNSRMKDFYDVWTLTQRFIFEGKRLCQAIKATFSRRNTPLPNGIPSALSPDYSEDCDKQAQWDAFVRRSKLSTEAKLSIVVVDLGSLLLPPTSAIIADESFHIIWSPSEKWQPKSD